MLDHFAISRENLERLVRLYRTDVNGNYRLVTVKLTNGTLTTDIPYASTGVIDNIKDGDLAETLPTQGWYEPPGCDLQRNIPVFLGRVFVALAVEHLEG